MPSKMKCKRALSPEPLLCVCGCEAPCKAEKFFVDGHDGRLRGFIVRGAPEVARVDWCSVPLCFHDGDYQREIKALRPTEGCAGPPRFVPKGSGGCEFDWAGDERSAGRAEGAGGRGVGGAMSEQRQADQGLCPCSCGRTPSEGRDWAQGHDQRVLSWIGWDDPNKLRKVDWKRVPITPAWRGFEPLVLRLRERQDEGDW